MASIREWLYIDRLFGPRASTVHRMEKRLVALAERLVEIEKRSERDTKSLHTAIEAVVAAQRQSGEAFDGVRENVGRLERRIVDFDRHLAQLDKRVAHASEGIAHLSDRTSKVDQRVGEIDDRFDRGIKSVRSAQHETKEALLTTYTRLAGVEDQFTRFHRRLQMVLRRQTGDRDSALGGVEGEPIQAQFGGPFLVAATQVVETQRTLLGYDRLYVIWQAVMNTAPLGLPAAEVGAYRGGSAHFIASALRGAGHPDTAVHVFDTFAGHPASKVSSVDEEHEVGLFGDADADDVKAYLGEFGNVRVHVGEFTENADAVADQRFSFVHVDVDTYVSTTDCLTFFTPRLAPGGALVLDDFRSEKCPGVAQAVAEFKELSQAYQVWDVSTEQLVLLRR